jgi:mono/diheme cytochrome c family protein
MSKDSNFGSRLERSGASDKDIQSVHADLQDKQEEPGNGYTLLPLFMLGFVSTMIFVVAIYFIHHRGGLDKGLGAAALIQHEGYNPDKHAVVAVVEIDAFAAGKKLYTSVCVACHQMGGTGLAGLYPPLVGSEWVTEGEARLVRILLHGLKGPIEVAGVAYPGTIPMPAFGAGTAYNWSDDKIAYVLTYIRAEWGNAASEISVETVTAIREATVNQVGEYTAEELLALP